MISDIFGQLNKAVGRLISYLWEKLIILSSIVINLTFSII